MNAKLFSTFVSQTQTENHFYQRVDAGKAQVLCQIADEVNTQTSNCCKKSKAGDKDLKELVNDHFIQFNQDGLEVIDTHLRRAGFTSDFSSRPMPPREDMDPNSWRRMVTK